MSKRIRFNQNLFDFVHITREDQQGERSLTNDMEAVLARLVKNGKLRPGDFVIYEDSAGMWDQVLIDARCEFAGFRVLNAASAIQAMSLVMENEP